MPTSQYAYTDVTDRADLSSPYPEVVAAFEALGWRAVGRYTMEYPPRVTERIVSGYREPARSEFRAHLPDVATVLLAPDGTAAAFVSWFWDQPAVRLSSLTADGALVETARLWTRKPPWPRALRSGWAGMDLREEVERSSVPSRGRSVRAVALGDPGELARPAVVGALVDAHLEHVAEHASAPVVLEDVRDGIALRRTAFEHDLRVRRRAIRVLFALVLVVAAVLGLLSGLIPQTRRATDVWLVVELVVLVSAVVWAQGWLLRHVSYWRWIRPAYR
jgi:hypothetical protein